MSSRPPLRHIRALLLACGCVIAAACGADDAEPSPTSGSVSLEALDGLWIIEQVEHEGRRLSSSSVIVDIRSEGAVVQVRSGCGQSLGSYTFEPSTPVSGVASFSLPGRPTAPCSDREQAEEDLVVGALEAVTMWSRTDDGAPGDALLRVLLENGSASDSVTLLRS